MSSSFNKSRIQAKRFFFSSFKRFVQQKLIFVKHVLEARVGVRWLNVEQFDQHQEVELWVANVLGRGARPVLQRARVTFILNIFLTLF